LVTLAATTIVLVVARGILPIFQIRGDAIVPRPLLAGGLLLAAS
jgi:hypothetical protein